MFVYEILTPPESSAINSSVSNSNDSNSSSINSNDNSSINNINTDSSNTDDKNSDSTNSKKSTTSSLILSEFTLSNVIENMKEHINILINEIEGDYIYTNPIQAILISEQYGTNENTNIDTNQLNSKLNQLIQKEVLKFANEKLHINCETIDSFSSTINFNPSHTKPNSIVSINNITDADNHSIDINSKQFLNYIDSVCQMFDKCYIIKPFMSDPYTDELYMIFGNKIKNNFVKNIIPINYENYIDFLYSLYSFGIHMLQLVYDIKYETSTNNIDYITLSSENEYKLIAAHRQMILKQLQ